MKDKILILAVILSVGCLAVAIRSSQIVDQNRAVLEKERYDRMVSEERLEGAIARSKSLADELANARNQMQSIQSVFEKTKLANVSLKEELEEVTKLNDILEKDLKNVFNSDAGSQGSR